MKLKDGIIGALNKLPYIRGLYRQNMDLRKDSCFPPGHYYSTIVTIDDIRKRESSIWDSEHIDGIIGINLQTENQLSLLNCFKDYYKEMPFSDQKQASLRYWFENDFYSYSDGIILYSMIRHFKPKQIIEIGSGFSSTAMLDINELFFGNQIALTLIEPYPDRLYSLIRPGDKTTTTIIEKEAQQIPLELFEQLNSGDILFIDSTHVVKTGNDVNYILFEILPRLKSGVLIHFHDIFYPFEYPREWVFMGRNWNENYFIKAFLMYNDKFEIKVFSRYLHRHHSKAFEEMPLCYRNFGGNLWIQKK